MRPGRGQMFEAEAESKILASRSLWPRGLNITVDRSTVVVASEKTDQTVENKLMTAIWSHGQSEADADRFGLGYFYRPGEIKYHAKNRGVISVNFHGQLNY